MGCRQPETLRNFGGWAAAPRIHSKRLTVARLAYLPTAHMLHRELSRLLHGSCTSAVWYETLSAAFGYVEAIAWHVAA